MDWIRAFQDQPDVVNRAFFGDETNLTPGFDDPWVMSLNAGLTVGF